MKVYLWAVIALSAVVWTLLAQSYDLRSWIPVLLLAAVAFILSSMAVDLPFATSISMAYAPIFAALVYAGPIGVAVVAGATGISVQELRERKPPLLMLGNVAQLSLSAAAAGLVFVAVGGQSLQSLSAPVPDLLASIVASVVATTTFFAMNLLLITMGISIKTGMRPGAVLIALQPTAYWVSLLVLTLLGLLVAYLITLKSWLGLALLVLPFWMARRTFRVYVELTEAYTSTVRSLVTAIEAKDPYTRGHSERVADYACRLAECIGIPKAEIDLIERAALLHDVGKIGISLDTLVSPEKLTPDEVNAIRQHPVLGSDLVSDVEFLSDIVDVVRHHHERCDGAGYPDGLVGERISTPARILAIADAYDAMTSDRAYRPRMTDAQAREELHRVADSQLDGDLVRQFTAMLSEDRVEGASA
jgi:putative nucleotidyltransferase with HDIG domain